MSGPYSGSAVLAAAGLPATREHRHTVHRWAQRLGKSCEGQSYRVGHRFTYPEAASVVALESAGHLEPELGQRLLGLLLQAFRANEAHPLRWIVVFESHLHGVSTLQVAAYEGPPLGLVRAARGRHVHFIDTAEVQRRLEEASAP